MTLETRIASAYGSLVIHLVVGTILFAGLGFSWCGDLACRGGHPVNPVELKLNPWTPWLDTPAPNDGVPGGDEPGCPPSRRLSSGAARLEEAPLPTGYDPRGTQVGRLIACVKLDNRAHVVSAYLLPGSGRTPLEVAVLREIRRQWRFSATGAQAAGWQRVRLYEESVAPPGKSFICGQLDWLYSEQGCKPIPPMSLPAL